MNFDINQLKWTRMPLDYTISADKIEITTAPHTDLWQRTYYHFRNDNAPVLQMETDEKFFSFTVKTTFDSKHRFDQCGIVMYLNSENWLKGSIEYENDSFQHLAVLLRTMDFPIGQLPKLTQASNQCGTDSAVVTMIIALRVQRMVLHSSKCAYATCGMVTAQSVSVFMPAVLRTHHSKQHLQIWSSRNVNGWHIMDSNQIQNHNCD